MTGRPRTAAPAADRLRAEVLAGLRGAPKTLPAKLFYDAEGARLFGEITALDEYYLTRAELEIMRRHAGEIAAMCGPECVLVEYGSGEASKTRLLLGRLERPAAYVPVDISAEQLARVAADVAREFPALLVAPVAADYTEPFELPDMGDAGRARRVAYFPGSTVGNLHPPEAVAFLRDVRLRSGPAGALVLGADLRKDPDALHAAYNDARGVTAAFNLNVLARLNRELGATFDAGRFRHYAYYNPAAGRVEMHLVSLEAHAVDVAGHRVAFERGESIWTESSYKYSPRELDEMACRAGFDVARRWTDAGDRFCVLFLTARGA